MKKLLILLTGVLMSVSACASNKIEEYAGREPRLDIREFFNGDVDAHGVFIARNGVVKQQFHVAMNGTWKGNVGTLKEHFTYMDGKTEDRVWTFRVAEDGKTITGTAGDVIGTATGAQVGNAVNMKYVLRMDVKGTKYNVSMDDWLYKLTDSVMVNRVQMSKFGFDVGQLVITFKKK